MAVYYKWIKGCAPGASLDSGLWTYIKWGNKKTADKTNTNLPHIYTYIGKKDNPTTENDLGYILTNDVFSATVSGNWTFNGENVFNKEVTFGTSSHFKDNINIYSEPKQGDSGKRINFYKDDQIFSYISDKDYADKNETKKLTIRTMQNNSFIELWPKTKVQISAGYLSIPDNYCEAQFFNATSDKRAKENIQPATYSALDLISKLPVYTFNYKNKDETVTGILAQDLLEAQPKELDLVSNVNATGENNDYMSIKNDKLMFVLMKAIQEQQEQIKNLEEEIVSLKKLI